LESLKTKKRYEDAADKFFRAKQIAKLHVVVYKEVVKSVGTITRLAKISGGKKF
jgi:hypothetical protein